MQVQAIAYRAVKLPSVILAALLITFLLFYFMQYLISTNNILGPQLSITRIIDATVPVFESIVIEEIVPPTPVEDINPPESAELERTLSAASGVTGLTRWIAPTAPTMNVTDIPLSSNVMIPLIRTTAAYPARALSRGIEGFVELSFTVNELGNVQYPVVIYAEPEGYFERAALQSIQRWKYSPALEKGEPVATHDVRQRIVFQIDPATH